VFVANASSTVIRRRVRDKASNGDDASSVRLSCGSLRFVVDRPTFYWQVRIATPGSEFLSSNHGDNCGSVPSDLLVCKASTHVSPKASRGSRVR
jgi:hypothetical protein